MANAWSFLAITDGAVAKSATTVGKGTLDHGIYTKVERNDGQSAREYFPFNFDVLA